MAPRRHKSYTAAFKLQVILKAETIGNRAAGREFGVDERCVRRWRSEKPSLEEMPKTKRARRSGSAHWPQLERSLKTWILEQREKGLSVSTVRMRLQAKNIAADMGISPFNGTANWCFRFMARHHLSVRQRTTVGQSLPEDWLEKKEKFLDFVNKIIEEKKFKHAQIINFDEVPLTFDCPPNRTVTSTGDKCVNITTSGHEKTSFTCVLACTASGEKLKPMLIFKRKTIPKEDFPPDVLIRCNEKGWVNEDLVIEWLNEVWRKRKGAFFQPSGLLVMDSMRAHLTDPVKKAAQKCAASLAIIPGGLTKKLQPLDLSPNHCFKSHMRQQWEAWMAGGLHSYTKGGNLRRPSYLEVARWVSAAWNAVKSTTIISSFVEAEIIPPTSVSNEDADEGSDADDDNDTLDEDFLNLFQSDSEESDFEGFQ